MCFCWLSVWEKAWRLYDLDTDEFFTSRDVRFQEDIFPYSIMPSTPAVLPQDMPSDIDDVWAYPTPTLSVPTSLAEVSQENYVPVIPPVTEENHLPSSPTASVPNVAIKTPATPSAVTPPLTNTTPPVTPGLPEVLGVGHR